MTYKLGSLFDGSGGFPLAGFLAGVEACWASEVEPYPIAVTRTRFPMMKHLGDISKVNGAEIEPVDIITFGSPCQDLSVAGKRAGLKHAKNGDEETTRSGLFMEAVRIIKEMREKTNGKYPRFALWENVPGAFSSNKGEDFRIVLEELIKIAEPTAVMPAVPAKGWSYADSYIGDGWSLAYRVFDAQYWGVPQRRRRIHLVADFGGQCAREVLFEREGVRGYFAEGGTPWEGTSDDAERSIGTADSEGAIPYTLKVRCGREGGGKGALVQKNLSATLACNNDQYVFQAVGFDMYNQASTGDKSRTIKTPVGGDDLPVVCYGIAAYNSNSMKSDNPHSGIYVADTSRTLDLNGGNPACNQGGIVIVEPIAVATQQGGAEITENGVCPTITAAAGMSGNNQPWICYDARGNGDGKTVGTITGDHENRITDYSSIVMQPVVYNGENITNPINKANPQPGDPCHTLGTDNRNYLVTADPVLTASKASFFMNTEEDLASTLVATDYKDPQLVCYSLDGDKIGKAEREGGSGLGIREGDKMYTLTAKDVHGVVYAIDRAFFNQGQNALYVPQIYEDGTVATLVAQGPSAVSYYYIVRRLTPTECARLQGFADRWGDIDTKTDFSDEEYKFWLDVRNAHAAINGKTVKEYTKKQMLSWYGKLATDSAEYKMWGNGIALPPALYCMQGIVDALEASK